MHTVDVQMQMCGEREALALPLSLSHTHTLDFKGHHIGSGGANKFSSLTYLHAHPRLFFYLLQNMKAVEEKGWLWVARAVGV